MHENDELGSQEQTTEKTDSKIDRRDALKRMGKYGAYTAPLMLAALTKDANAQVPCCSP